MDEFINNINIEDTIVNTDNIINKNDCSIVISEIGRRAYINSNSGRSELLADCTQYNRMDLYEEVLNTWGEDPTIEDEVIPEKTLDQLKQEKFDELESRFTERVKGSFITDEGYKMQFNTDDSLKMFGAIQLLESQNAESGYITDADDNTHYEVPVSVMKSVQDQMLKKYAQCHLLKQQYRSMINEAESVEDLTKINIVFE
jgi:hypothetical protein